MIVGCPSQPRVSLRPQAPRPLYDVVSVVNANAAAITNTLRARGVVDGYFTSPQGRRRSYHVDGTLFYLDPSYLRFDLKKLGTRMLLFGSNDTNYWIVGQKDEDSFCGRHGVADDLPPDTPISPTQLIEALGLSSIPVDYSALDDVQYVQRIVPDYQQILFFDYNHAASPILNKEYWIDRRAPYLVSKVIFRDEDGQVEMESSLSQYRRHGGVDCWLPYVMEVVWPKAQAYLRFQVRQWKQFEAVTPTSPQFVTHEVCENKR